MRECTYILNVCASWRSSIEFTEGGLGDQSLNTSYQHREIIIFGGYAVKISFFSLLWFTLFGLPSCIAHQIES